VSFTAYGNGFEGCGSERERERERALLGTIHTGGPTAAPAHGLRVTTLRSASPYTLDGVAAYMVAPLNVTLAPVVNAYVTSVCRD
jgi:hypothetical protein